MSEKRITVYDRASYAVNTQREFTDEGFLKVPGHVARAGIQQYLARELGLDGDPNRIVNVYRPEDEVFNEDSMASYAGADVTLEHPKGFVDSNNYSNTSKGVVIGSGERDGDFVKCNLFVKDKATIDAILSGKCELSAGYSAYYVPEEGVHDNKNYEFVQKGIKINHVAVVDRARAGGQARIFDNNEVENMTKKITLDGVELEVDQKVADHIAQLTADKDKIEAERDNDRAEVKRLKEERKEDDYDVEKLRARVRELEDEKAKIEKDKVTKDAEALTGKVFDGDSVDAIMRQALDSAGFKTEGKSNDYVAALFDMQMASKDTVDASHRSFAEDSYKKPQQTVDARAEFIKKSKDAYKTGAK